MRNLKSFIQIRSKASSFTTGFEFDFITDVEITSGWDVFTDTAKVTIPKRLLYRKNGKATEYIAGGEESIFERGDKITIQVGYESNPVFGDIPTFYTAFQGYITEISPRKPMVILCEDAMYLLKKVKIEKYESDGPKNLRELFTDLQLVANFPANEITQIRTVDMNVGEVIIENLSFAKFLDYLKRTYGLLSYVKGSTLYCGFANITQSSEDAEILPNKIISVDFRKELISRNNMNYKKKDDVLISLKAYSILEDNSRLESIQGDDDGDTRNLYYYNIDQDSLDKIAKEQVDKFKYNGYRGSFTMFGVPQIVHGNAVDITPYEDVPDEAGTYIVRQVKTKHGTGGCRQEIFLDKRID